LDATRDAGSGSIVVGILASLVWDMAQQSLHSLFEAAIIISSLAALLRDFNPILIVFGALAIGLIFLRPEQNAPSDQIFVVYEDAHVWWKTAAVGMVVLAIVVTAALSQNTLGRLSLSLSKPVLSLLAMVLQSFP